MEDTKRRTVAELLSLIKETGGDRCPENDIDLISPGLCVGSYWPLRFPETLTAQGISHVVCCCEKELGEENKKRILDKGLEYCGFPADDLEDYDITQWFEPAADFIEKSLNNKGVVSVHCMAGCSRAATITLAYLMLKRHLTVGEALRMVRTKRHVSPNEGFLLQLCQLNERLRLSGHFSRPEDSDSKKAESESTAFFSTLEARHEDSSDKMGDSSSKNTKVCLTCKA